MTQPLSPKTVFLLLILVLSGLTDILAFLLTLLRGKSPSLLVVCIVMASTLFSYLLFRGMTHGANWRTPGIVGLIGVSLMSGMYLYRTYDIDLGEGNIILAVALSLTMLVIPEGKAGYKK